MIFLYVVMPKISLFPEPASIGSDDSVQLTDDGQENPETSRVKRDAWTAIDFGNSLANMVITCIYLPVYVFCLFYLCQVQICP